MIWKNVKQYILIELSATETIDGSALSLECVDDVHSCDGLSAGVLSVGDGVTDDAFEEALEDLSGIVVHEGGDTLDASSAGEPPDGGLGDALDGGLVAPLLGDPLGANLSLASDSFSAFADSCHFNYW